MENLRKPETLNPVKSIETLLRGRFLLPGSLLLWAVFALGCGAPGGTAASADFSRSLPASPEQAKANFQDSPAAAGSVNGGAAGEKAKEPVLPRKIIYTADVSLVTESLDKAEDQLMKLIKASGGYVSQANKMGRRSEVRTGTWTVRLPSNTYESFVSSLKGLGELESANQQTEDVSDEFYDAQARLKNKRIQEVRLQQLLAKATGKLTEVLTVEQEIARVRGEIEQIEGRLRYLSNRVDLSTITISIREVQNYVPAGPPTLQTRLERSFKSSMAAMGEFFTAILLALVGSAPWLVFLGVLGSLGWILIRTIRGKSKPNPAA